MAAQLSIKSSTRLSSGYDLPLLGLGVYQNDDAKPASLAALKHGYLHIDSARYYGNEAQVGEAVRESGIPREQVFITTKLTNEDHGFDSTLAAVDQSLKRFEFEYLDFILIHSAMSDKERRLATWRALIEAKKQGKVKAIGVSNYGVKHLEEIREAGLETPAINQIELHPLCQQKEIVDYSKKHNILIEAYTPLIRGQWDVPAITAAAKKYNKTPAQILIRWSLQRGFAPLPKSSNPERVVSNADVFDFEIDAEDMASIDALDRGKAGAITWNPVDVD
ncbi:Aldo/keto reductase [Trametes versicolor FP-101664 SS1]|uniref:Aldo/keto reductase n=1 Tax=Trametes versicolor (strain FP-101664) TaxID=717944 RepID=R7S7L1_TRAVS|nr:Aldo/keto reductase [Trametes versicolor FP-101664 SS1]EIW51597.1 Aldo/keto reductase [Trametes versicolor FP-101664 SS1]